MHVKEIVMKIQIFFALDYFNAFLGQVHLTYIIIYIAHILAFTCNSWYICYSITVNRIIKSV